MNLGNQLWSGASTSEVATFSLLETTFSFLVTNKLVYWSPEELSQENSAFTSISSIKEEIFGNCETASPRVGYEPIFR